MVAGTTVRLKGVDTNELGTARGENARRVMIGIVSGGVLSCHLTGEKTWRREVGYCFTTNGVDINPRRAEVAYAPCGYCFELIGLSFVVLR